MKKREYYALFIIILICIIIFGKALFFNFTIYDDNSYVTENVSIRSFYFENIYYFFSNYFNGNYHPLTMISYSIDYLIFGLNPLGFHLTNLIIHIFNIIFVFLMIRKLFDNLYISFIATLIFAIHPVQIESVVWIAERKNVLYSLFYLSSLIMYIDYIKLVKYKYLFLSLFFFILSCLSKGLAVSLPLILILLDYFYKRKMLDKKVIIEKLPFFTIALIAGIIAVYAQESQQYLSKSVGSDISFLEQISLISYSFFDYIFSIFFPINITEFYPYPSQNNEILLTYGVFIIVPIAFIIVLIYTQRKNRLLFFASAFFATNILFVLQILPYANILRADRYLYLAIIGISIIIAILIDYLKKRLKINYLTYILIIPFILFISIFSVQKIPVWSNSLSLFNDILDHYPNLPSILNLRGIVYKQNENYEASLHDFNKVLSINPKYYDTYNNRGNVYMHIHKFENAKNDFLTYLKYNPNNSAVISNLGIVYAQTGDINLAIKMFNEAIRKDAQNYSAYANLGKALAMLGNFNTSLNYLNKAIKLNSNFSEAYVTRAMVYLNLSQKQKGYNDLIIAKKLGNNEAEKLLKKYL